MLRDAEHLLTVAEAAVELRQHPNTIRRKIAEGLIPAVRLGRGPRAPLRVRADSLDRFLRERADTGQDEAGDR